MQDTLVATTKQTPPLLHSENMKKNTNMAAAHAKHGAPPKPLKARNNVTSRAYHVRARDVTT